MSAKFIEPFRKADLIMKAQIPSTNSQIITEVPMTQTQGLKFFRSLELVLEDCHTSNQSGIPCLQQNGSQKVQHGRSYSNRSNEPDFF
jgi:hypothetical protein